LTKTFDKLLLRDSQVDTAQFIIDNPNCAIFSEMGFGKTASVLTAIEKLLVIRDIKKALVVSPLLVARETWPQEVKAWAHTAGIEISLLLGSASERMTAAKRPAPVHIINQENFVWLVEQAGRKWPYDMVVFDDAKGFKSAKRKSRPKTLICMEMDGCPGYEPDGSSKACKNICEHFRQRPARFTRFGALCALRPQIKRLVHLTGTPSSQGLLDLWPLIFTLDNGKRLGRTFTQYKNVYFRQNYNGFGWTLQPGSAEVIHDKIKDICIALPTEAKVPPAKHIPIKVQFPEKAEKLYYELETELLLELGDNTVEAPNAGVLAGKLLQVCGGAVYTSDDPSCWKEVHDAKLDALKEILSWHPDESVLVAYNFQHELKRLRWALPGGKDIRDSVNSIRDWNRGKLKLMFAHPDSAGHGLNLQHGGHILVWYGLNWSLALNKQFNKRLHRPGQKHETLIYYLIADGKADEQVMRCVQEKDVTQQALLDAVKRQAQVRRLTAL